MEPDLGALYRGPLDEFVARRTAASKALRSNDPDAAAAVGKMRKPSVGAWAIDQVAAEEPDLIGELLAAGADLRAVQQAASGGEVSGEVLREATGRVRRAVDAVSTAVASVLDRAGHPPSEETTRRARTTLQSAATGGAGTRRALWRGTLDRDLEPAGFGVADGDGDDSADLIAALAPFRRKPREHGLAKPTKARDRRPSAADRAAERRAAELGDAARRAREIALTRRASAKRLAEAARLADQEAAAAERAADAAEAAARPATGRS